VYPKEWNGYAVAQLVKALCYKQASTSWNPLGLSRPVMGLLYLYLRNGTDFAGDEFGRMGETLLVAKDD
jgi:hypothetical protein